MEIITDTSIFLAVTLDEADRKWVIEKPHSYCICAVEFHIILAKVQISSCIISFCDEVVCQQLLPRTGNAIKLKKQTANFILLNTALFYYNQLTRHMDY